jgi:hypothetical protein
MHLFHFVFGRGFPVQDLYDRMFLEDVFGRLLLSWDGHILGSRFNLSMASRRLECASFDGMSTCGDTADKKRIFVVRHRFKHVSADGRPSLQEQPFDRKFKSIELINFRFSKP